MTRIRKTYCSVGSLVRLHYVLALQIGKTAGWDYFLGAVGENLVCQDLSVHYFRFFHSSLSQISHVQFI